MTYKHEPWHRECFTCTHCNNSLAGERFTSRDEKPYCSECFGELFAKRCTACSKPITGQYKYGVQEITSFKVLIMYEVVQVERSFNWFHPCQVSVARVSSRSRTVIGTTTASSALTARCLSSGRDSSLWNRTSFAPSAPSRRSCK